MSIVKKGVAAALAALAVLGIAAGPASASDTVTFKDTGTPLDAAVFGAGGHTADGDRIAGHAPVARIESSVGELECESQFLSTVVENPGDGSAGRISGGDHRAEIELDPAKNRFAPLFNAPNDVLTFTSCTDTLPIIDVTGAQIVGDIVGAVDGATQTIELRAVTIQLRLTLGLTCTYVGDLVGVFDEATQTVTFATQQVSRSAGSMVCPPSGDFSAVYHVAGYESTDTALATPRPLKIDP